MFTKRLKTRENARQKMVLAVASLAIVGISACQSGAQVISWTGPATGNWSAAANWSAGVPNSASATAVVDNSPGQNSTVNVDAGFTVGTLQIAALDQVSLNPSVTLVINTELVNANLLTVGNAANLNLAGSVNNAGVIVFNPNGAENFLNVGATAVNITGPGTGTIQLNWTGTGPAAVILAQSSGTLTLGVGQVVQGVGSFRNSRVINNGLIDANSGTAGVLGAGISIDPSNQGTNLFINNGTMRSSNGGLMVFTGDFGGEINSTGGNIQANGAGSVVRFVNNATVTGGNYSTTGGGEIVVDASQTGNASPQSISGIFRLRNNATLNMSGTVNNTGVITFSPNGNENFLTIGTAPLTLNGAGTIQMDWVGTGPAGVILAGSTGTLTLGASQVVQGVGSFRNARVINNGLIDANSGTAGVLGGGMFIDPSNQGTNLFINNGTMRSGNGGLMVIAGDFGGEVLNNGTIAAIGNNSSTEFFNNVTVTGGNYTTSGTGVVRVRSGHTGNASGFTITPGSQFQVPQSARLNISGTITNNGSLNVNAGTNSAALGLPLATTLQGSGITRFNGTATTDATLDSQGTLTIAAGHVVRGDGYFNNVRVINNGSIIGDDSVARLGGTYLDPNNQIANPFINNGTIGVVANNLVSLVGDSGGGFSGNGVYRADGANAFLHLANNVSVVGGNYTTTGGGVVRVPAGHTGNISDATITAGSTFNVDNNSRLNISGTITNNGSLNVTSGASNSFLGSASAATLTGSGITRLTTPNQALTNAQVDGAGTLTIAAGHVVRGNGYFNNNRVINNGAIIGDVADGGASSMYLDPNNQAADLFVNNGTIQAVAASKVTLAGDSGGNFTGNGVYRADGAGAVVQLINNIDVNGGNFTTTTGGEIRVAEGHIARLIGSTLTAGSNFSVLNNAQLNLIGTVTNNGNLTVTSGPSSSFLSAVGSATLTGSGVTRLTGNPGVSNASVDSQATLTIAAGHTLAGAGYLNNTRLINNGTILADQTGNISMYVDPSNQIADAIVNNGTLRATSGTINLAGDSGGNIAGNGPLIADAGGTIQAINGIAGDIGPVSGAGTYRAQSSSNLGHQHFRIATLEANTSARARVTSGGGTLGTSKVNTLTITTSGRLDLTDHDMLIDYTGASPFADIKAALQSGYGTGTFNGSVGIISSTAGASTNPKTAIGYAEATDVLGPVGGPFSGQTADGTTVLLRYTLSGDANLDKTVNLDDFTRLAAGFGVSTIWSGGDFNYNGSVTLDDFTALAANFGRTLAADLPRGSAVPEPATLSLLAGAALLAGRRRKV